MGPSIAVSSKKERRASPVCPKIERTYFGERDKGVCSVWVEDSTKPEETPVRRTLPLHLEVRNHSPSGFEWGYAGSGPAQLALALLIEVFGDTEIAQRHYQDFKFEVIAFLGDTWQITASAVRGFVNRHHT